MNGPSQLRLRTLVIEFQNDRHAQKHIELVSRIGSSGSDQEDLFHIAGYQAFSKKITMRRQVVREINFGFRSISLRIRTVQEWMRIGSDSVSVKTEVVTCCLA